jgi:hypothetical protein
VHIVFRLETSAALMAAVVTLRGKKQLLAGVHMAEPVGHLPG